MVCICSGIFLIVGLIIVYRLIWSHLRKETVGDYQNRCFKIDSCIGKLPNCKLEKAHFFRIVGYILITGCDTGFGSLLSKRLDGLGCHVFSGCLTDQGADSLQKECSSRLVSIKLDVTNPDSVRNAHRIITSKLPNGKGLWAVINNAGIGGTIGAPEWLITDNYRETCEVNLFGMIEVTMTFLSLIKQEKGRVVNMSSLTGRLSTLPLMPYSVSKFGVESFSDGLRRAMHPYGVKVVIMEPGWTATTLTARETSVLPGLAKGWEQASQEMKEEYGEEYYNFCKTKMFDDMDRIGSSDPVPVIDALQEAILGRYPYARYVTGIDGRFILMPLMSLPEWFGDFIIRLVAAPPLPAKLKKLRSVR